jgi:hypothetical protein
LIIVSSINVVIRIIITVQYISDYVTVVVIINILDTVTALVIGTLLIIITSIAMVQHLLPYYGYYYAHLVNFTAAHRMMTNCIQLSILLDDDDEEKEKNKKVKQKKKRK